LQKHGVFEDTAGGSIEAKWLSRRADTGYRQSQPSFNSIPGYANTTPEGTRPPSPSTARRLAAEAPTSFGPVVTRSSLRSKRRLLVPAALALLALVGISARLLWPSTTSSDAKPLREAAQVVPTTPPTAAVSTAPAPLPTASTKAEPAPEPTPVTRVHAPKSPPSRSPKPHGAGSAHVAAGKRDLDLLTPY
jgi:hypothetical protein